MPCLRPAGRKLQQRDNNSGAIVANTRQAASNAAVDSANVNQANANQNAQAAGNRAAAVNAAAVDQRNGGYLSHQDELQAMQCLQAIRQVLRVACSWICMQDY